MQAGQIQLRTGSKEMFLRLFENIHPCQHPSTRCLCCIVHFSDMTPGPFLVQELLAGKEPVDQEVETLVQPVQEINLLLGVTPVIPHELPDDRIVLLLPHERCHSCDTDGNG